MLKFLLVVVLLDRALYACGPVPPMTPIGYRDGSDAARFAIDDPYTHYLRRLYSSLLGRDIDPSGFDYWRPVFGDGNLENVMTVSTGVTSSIEAHCMDLKKWSLQYFIRDLSSDTYWQNLCHSAWPTDWRSVVTAMLVSDEFYNAAPSVLGQSVGATFSTYVQAVYQKVLGRSWTTSDPSWQGYSRSEFANAVLSSYEAATFAVTQWYERFLGRAPDASGLALWATQLQTQSYDLLLGQFLAQGEFLRGPKAQICTIGGSPIYADPSGTDPAADAVQNCINANYGGTLAIPAGVYRIEKQLSITAPITLTTLEASSQFAQEGCLTHAGPTGTGHRCATFWADPNYLGVRATNPSNALLYVHNDSGLSNVWMDHIVVHGNHAQRALNPHLFPRAFNVDTNCLNCGFNFGGSVWALEGTGLGFGGDNGVVTANVIAYNGQTSPAMGNIPASPAIASDGLTINSHYSCVWNNQMINNTDIDLISGRGQGAIISWNRIYHSDNSTVGSSGGIMLDNFSSASGGEFWGADIGNNWIHCGSVAHWCRFGIMIGGHNWYFNHSDGNPTLYPGSSQDGENWIYGGYIHDNVVENADQGINIQGAQYTVLKNNEVTGFAPLDTPICGTFSNTSQYNVGPDNGPGLDFENGVIVGTNKTTPTYFSPTNHDWRNCMIEAHTELLPSFASFWGFTSASGWVPIVYNNLKSDANGIAADISNVSVSGGGIIPTGILVEPPLQDLSVNRPTRRLG